MYNARVLRSIEGTLIWRMTGNVCSALGGITFKLGSYVSANLNSNSIIGKVCIEKIDVLMEQRLRHGLEP